MNAPLIRATEAEEGDPAPQIRRYGILERGKRLFGLAKATVPSSQTRAELASKSSKPKARAGSSRQGDMSESHLNGGIDDMLTIEQVVARGEGFYEKLRPLLESDHLYEEVCINLTTGEYVLGDSVQEVHRKFKERFGEVPSWNTTIGAPTHVSIGERGLH